MNHLATLNPENVTEQEVATYRTRHACRAVVPDDEGLIALLHVTNENYYKLPGGGADEGETDEEALKRECLEEIGCNIEITGELGQIVEYRKIFEIKQISNCYTARAVGTKGVPAFTDFEKAKGFEVVWLPFDQALQSVRESNAATFEGKEYIVPRDTALLEAAQK